MKNYREIYNSRFPKYLKDTGLSTGKIRKEFGASQDSVAWRWMQGDYPGITFLVKMSKRFNVNIAYLLGITDIKTPNENYEIKSNLKKLMTDGHFTLTSLSKLVGTQPSVVKKLLDDITKVRTNTIIAFSESLGVSVDHLLGLTDRKIWEIDNPIESKFSLISVGEPAYIYFNNKKSFYCFLINRDFVIMPNGDEIPTDSDEFTNAKVYPVMPISNAQYLKNKEDFDEK